MSGEITVTPTIVSVNTTTSPVTVTVTQSPVAVTTTNQGLQGAQSVVAATSPITYNSSTQTVGITQSALSLAPEQITGTAYTQTQVNNKFHQSTSTWDVPARAFVSGTALLSAYVGSPLRGQIFAPERDLTVSTISVYVSQAANWTGATSAQAKVALYTLSGTTLTPLTISSFASNPFTAATSFYNFSITSTALSANTYYGVALTFSYGGTPTTVPSLAVQSLAGSNFAAATPPMTFVSGATNISGTTSANGINQSYYFRLS